MPRKKVEDMVKIKIVKDKPAPVRESKAVKSVLPPLYTTTRRNPRYLLWAVAALSVIFLFFSISYVFSSAEITITPRVEDVAINENLSASKDSLSIMPFDLVVIDGVETKNAQAQNKKEIKSSAKGMVILYNDFSANSQLLSIDTRLEGSNGKIYKTERRIVVPGRGGDGSPGKVEVGIYAAAPGPGYDSGPLDFKIFGFKGTPKYQKIYGRSKGSIEGGVSGEFYAITEAEKAKVTSELQVALKEELLQKATLQIPKGYVLFKDAAFLAGSPTVTGSYSKESIMPVSLKGTLYGFLLEEKKLTKKIAKDAVGGYDGSDVHISNLKDLTFSLLNKGDAAFGDMKTINFTLKGSAKIVWKFDPDKFALELLNRRKKDFNLALSKYPNVVSANLTLKPFWRMTLPKKLKSIGIMVNYPK